MGSSERRLVAGFLVAGVVSGVVCWAGGFLLPEGSLALNVYPGLIVGLTLFALGRIHGLGEGVPRFLTLVILGIAGVAGWRAGVDIGYPHGGPLPMLTAGALGALVLALGVSLGWAVRRKTLPYLAVVTLTGAVAGQIFELVSDASPYMNEQVWMLALFVEWQTLVLLSIGLATVWSRSGR